MDALAGWLYVRFRRRYIGIMESIAVLSAFVLLGVPIVVSAIWASELDLADAGGLLAVSLVLLVVMVSVSVRTERKQLEPLRTLVRDGVVDPGAVWATAIRAPRVITGRTAVMSIVPLVLLSQWVASTAELGTWGRIGISGYAFYTAGSFWFVISIAFDVVLRPMKEEVVPQLGAGLPQVAGWRLTTKVTGGAVVIASLAGLLFGGLAWQLETPDGRLPAIFVGSLLISALLGTLFWAAIAQPALRPLRDLTEATVRVRRGDYTQPIPVTTVDEIGDLVEGFNAMQEGLLERAALHAAFGTYVDPGLAERVVAQGHGGFTGEEVEVTVFFVDVRDFTAYSESVSTGEAFALLNRLFGVVVPIVREHGGHPNRYLGDGVLAVFGAPLGLDDHADRAVAAARAIQRAVASAFDGAVRIGIGINSGPVMAGTIGGGGKLEYTVIGDPVNVASRIEELTKETGDGILLTSATAELLEDPLDLLDRGKHDLRGKAVGVQVFAVDDAG